MAKTKQLNIRVSEESLELFSAMCEWLGWTKSQAVENMLFRDGLGWVVYEAVQEIAGAGGQIPKRKQTPQHTQALMLLYRQHEVRWQILCKAYKETPTGWLELQKGHAWTQMAVLMYALGLPEAKDLTISYDALLASVKSGQQEAEEK